MLRGSCLVSRPVVFIRISLPAGGSLRRATRRAPALGLRPHGLGRGQLLAAQRAAGGGAPCCQAEENGEITRLLGEAQRYMRL